MSEHLQEGTLEPEDFEAALDTIMSTFAVPAIRDAVVATLSPEERQGWANAFRRIADQLDPTPEAVSSESSGDGAPAWVRSCPGHA